MHTLFGDDLGDLLGQNFWRPLCYVSDYDDMRAAQIFRPRGNPINLVNSVDCITCLVTSGYGPRLQGWAYFFMYLLLFWEESNKICGGCGRWRLWKRDRQDKFWFYRPMVAASDDAQNFSEDFKFFKQFQNFNFFTSTLLPFQNRNWNLPIKGTLGFR